MLLVSLSELRNNFFGSKITFEGKNSIVSTGLFVSFVLYTNLTWRPCDMVGPGGRVYVKQLHPCDATWQQNRLNRDDQWTTLGRQ